MRLAHLDIYAFDNVPLTENPSLIKLFKTVFFRCKVSKRVSKQKATPA
jgi:hypothetical protein